MPGGVKVERPRGGGSGDYATNAALQLAGPAALPARRVAEILRERLAGAAGIERVEITGPGFLNFTLRRDSHAQMVSRVLGRRHRYGHGRSLAGQVLQYHHRTEVRAAVVAQTVARLQAAQGASVRTGCDAVDPRWAALGVTVDAEGMPPGPLPVVVAPAPVTYDVYRLGRDAARWALLRPAAHDRALGPDGLLDQTEANGLFTVRYAHARARALLRNGAQLGITPAYEEQAEDPAYQEHGEDYGEDTDALRLLAALGDHPAVLEAAARHRAPDRVARHLEATADAFLGFQHTVLPLGDEKPSAAHRSRLALAEAAGTVLAGGLALLGISAPDYL